MFSCIDTQYFSWHLENFKKQVAAGGEVNPIVVDMGEETEFYYPIITNSMCLKCHGTPGKELESLTLSKILELYPKDNSVYSFRLTRDR